MIYIITGSSTYKSFSEHLKQSDIVEYINVDSISIQPSTKPNIEDFYIETAEISNKDIEVVEQWLDGCQDIVQFNIELRKSIKENNSKINLMNIICNEDLPYVTITSGNNYTKASYSQILEYFKYN